MDGSQVSNGLRARIWKGSQMEGTFDKFHKRQGGEKENSAFVKVGRRLLELKIKEKISILTKQKKTGSFLLNR